ncbi:hypothetical protein BH11PSE3_BH11PSE3_23970 [soil metagenome]
MAVAVIVNDALAWWAEGSFRLLSLGDLWSHLDVGSLGHAQSAVQHHLSTALWTWFMRPLLLIPALPTFLVLGLFFLWFGSRSGGEPQMSFVGSRPPRRRRSRGLT